MSCGMLWRAIPSFCLLVAMVLGASAGDGRAEQSSPTRADARYTTIYSDGVEGNPGGAPAVGPGLLLLNGATVVTDPSLVIAGKGSVRLANGATVATNPDTLPLAANSTYIVELQYRVINRGTNDNLLIATFRPAADLQNSQAIVSAPAMLKNAETTGTFSTGAMTAGAGAYTLRVSVVGTAELIVDDIRIIRQDAVMSAEVPARFQRLRTLPFPRLGNYINGSSISMAQGFTPEKAPFLYTVTQIEKRLALSDVIAGVSLSSQTVDPAFLRRLRILNPDAVLLAYRISEEQIMDVWHPSNATINVEDQLLNATPDEWYVRNTKGEFLLDDEFNIRFMNISPFCPVIKGATFLSLQRSWLQETVLPSGVWDGIFFDNLVGRTNPHLPNFSDPSLFDADYNRNGVRDETLAAVSDMNRAASSETAGTLRTRNGNLQLFMGNTGPMPEPALAPYLNGMSFEVMNFVWTVNHPSPSPGAWRHAFDAYRWMDANVREPRINIIHGSGPKDGSTYTDPTPADVKTERFVLGTALLGDGFYDFDLHGRASIPTWWDEFAVNQSGVAMEDRSGKGYLGQALTGATELSDRGTLVFEELFDRSALPASIGGTSSDAAVVSTNPYEVITGTGSLVVQNAEYGKNQQASAYVRTNALSLTAGNTYDVVFDWRVIDTLNRPMSVGVYANGQTLDSFQLIGAVAGDSGTVHFPLSVTTAAPWSLNFGLMSGGKVAIDNLRVYRGGVGPWRRDFENGFVLVNPFNEPYTFSAADLAGSLRRTGIRRIKGTQAPEVNSGQRVTDSLTLGPFDAIVLLADHISRPQRRRAVGR